MDVRSISAGFVDSMGRQWIRGELKRMRRSKPLVKPDDGNPLAVLRGLCVVLAFSPTFPPNLHTLPRPPFSLSLTHLNPYSLHSRPSTRPIPDIPSSTQMNVPDGPSLYSAPLPEPNEREGHRCMWAGCDKVATDPEVLYAHLCNEYVSTNSDG